MIDLTENQLKLLRALVPLGEGLCVPPAENVIDYGVLAKADCVSCLPLHDEAFHYTITVVGQERLDYHREAGRGSN